MTDAATDTSWFDQLPPGKMPAPPSVAPPRSATAPQEAPDNSWFTNLPPGKTATTATATPYKPPALPMPTPIGVDDFGSPIYDTSTPEGAQAAAEQRDPTSRMIEKAGEGATFGLLPHIVAGIKSWGSSVPPEMGGTLTPGSDMTQTQQTYQKALADQRAYTAETSRQYPIASQVAEGVGALAPTVATFGLVNPLEAGAAKLAPTLMAKGLPKFLGSTVANAVVGAGAGAANAVGHDVGMGTTENMGSDALSAAEWGGAIGGAAPTVGYVAGKIWDGTKWVYDLAGSKGVLPKTSYATEGGNADYMAPTGSIRATPQQFNAAMQKIEGAATPEHLTNPATAKFAAQRSLDAALEPNTLNFEPAANPPGPLPNEVPEYERTLPQQMQSVTPAPGIAHLQTAYADSDTYGPRFAALQHGQQSTLAHELEYPNGSYGADMYEPGREFTRQLDSLREGQSAALASQGAAVEGAVSKLGQPPSASESGATIKGAVDTQYAPTQAAADQAVTTAQAARDQALAATPAGKQPIPGGATVPEQYGAEARAQAIAGQRASSDNLTALKAIVGNPDTTTAPLKTTVGSLYSSLPSTAAPPAGGEAAIQKLVAGLPDTLPLDAMTALRDRVSDEITREATSSGTTSTAVARRLMATKSAIDDAINAPLAARDAAEQAAVQGGTMAPADTMSAKLQAYQQYRQAAQQHAQTFSTGAVNDILQPGEYPSAAKELAPDLSRARGGFQTPDAAVLDKIWNGQTVEAANLRGAQAAGISPEVLKGYAADDLRQAAVDANGNLDPQAYSRWRRQHAAGLHVFPEVQAAFDGVDAAQATLAARQTQAAATAAAHPLAGITDPANVPDHYMVRGDAGVAQVKAFIDQTGGDPAAMQALDDSFVRKMYNVPGLVDQNTGLINAPKLQKLTADYAGMLGERPELAGKLSNIADAQKLYDTVRGQAAIDSRAYQNGVAKNFLGGLDPVAAVQKVFDGPNSEANFKALVDRLQGNPDALEGMQAAVSRYLVNKARSAGLQSSTGMNPLKTEDLTTWISHNKPTLLDVYGNGTTLNNIYAVMKELRLQAEVSNTAGAIPTAAKSLFKESQSTAHEGVSGGGMLMGLLAGHIVPFIDKLPGGEETAMLIGGSIKTILRSFQQAGLQTQDDLVATMLASPATTRAWRELVHGASTPLQVNRLVQSLMRTTPNVTGLTKPTAR